MIKYIGLEVGLVCDDVHAVFVCICVCVCVKETNKQDSTSNDKVCRNGDIGYVCVYRCTWCVCLSVCGAKHSPRSGQNADVQGLRSPLTKMSEPIAV